VTPKYYKHRHAVSQFGENKDAKSKENWDEDSRVFTVSVKTAVSVIGRRYNNFR
jgi:hypothetical protein